MTIPWTNLFDNDTDTDGPEDLVAYIAAQPAHGTLERNDADGSFTYTPDAGYTGTDSFKYTAFDGEADSIPVTVTISVGVNIPPIANDDFLSTDVDTPLTIVREDVLGNDSDPDGDIGAVYGQIVDQPVHGELGFDMDGNAVYTPTPASRAPTVSPTNSTMAKTSARSPPSPSPSDNRNSTPGRWPAGTAWPPMSAPHWSSPQNSCWPTITTPRTTHCQWR